MHIWKHFFTFDKLDFVERKYTQVLLQTESDNFSIFSISFPSNQGILK